MIKQKEFKIGIKTYSVEKLAEICCKDQSELLKKIKRLGSVERAVGIIYTWENKTHNLIAWAKIKGIPLATIRRRYSQGWRGEKLFKKLDAKSGYRERLRKDQIEMLKSFERFAHY